ncbi:Flp pilus assembly protein CpaB [Roseibium limicola]|uniref:Flp pilus assembly protein CpaB n=1 Tax=Roseibium limicola TaxID=2816037 RepID=A0A939ENA1_9HYPH|nr:Flp pilus assembly protein CpaB [Roseibium limicola]MBO0345689.1 Flp pilus assembly protein CpaB [Roseibium limicola]
MKYARLLVLGVALGAGLIAARLVMNTGASDTQQSLLPDPSEINQEQVLVAARDIPPGNKLTGGDLKWAPWPADALPQDAIVKSGTPEGRDEYAGQLAKAMIFSGEPIRPQRLVNTDRGYMAAILPKGKRAISVGVATETTAGGFILPGDKVDLLLTRNDRGGQGVQTETILENIRILAIDTVTVGEREEKTLSPKRTATLELTPQQAETVAQAQKLGTIDLALRSAADSSDTEEAEPQRKGGVSFVKYGVTTQATAQ